MHENNPNALFATTSHRILDWDDYILPTVDKKVIQKIITEQLERRDWTNKIITEGIFLPKNELRYEK